MSAISETSWSYLVTFIFQLPFEAALEAAQKVCLITDVEMNEQVDRIDIGPWTLVRTSIQALDAPDKLNVRFQKWTAEMDLRLHYPDEEGNDIQVPISPSTEDEYVFYG